MTVNLVDNIRALSKQVTPIMVMAAAVGFVIAVVIITLIIRVLYENYQRVRTKKLFRSKMEKLGLNQNQKNDLTKMMESECPGNPKAILEDRLTFEKAVQRRMAHGRVIANGKELSDREKQLHALREKLGFLPSKDAALFSTRGLKEGMEVNISIADIDGSQVHLNGKVNCERDALLEVKLDTEPPTHLFGAVAQVAFFPGKSSFGFTSTIRDIDSEENLIFLEHTLALSRVDKRRFERFEVHKPVDITLREDGREENYTMELDDLSAGGMAVASEQELRVSDYTVFDVKLSAYELLPETEETRQTGESKFSARIIRTSQTNDKKTMYHCEFINVSREQRQFLYRLTKLIEKMEGGKN